jgi:hypothetical protein
MRTIFAVIGWSLVGCTIAPLLTYEALALFTSSSNSALLLLSLWAGLMLGATYGAIRQHLRRSGIPERRTVDPT